MKKRRIIAAITALMCAGTVFVPNMAVTAAAETQTSAVQTDFPDSIRSDIEAYLNENHISAQTYIAPISEGKDCLHVLFYADQDEEMKKTEEYLIQNDIPYLNTVIDTTTGRTKGFVILKPNYIDSFKSKVKAFMNENNISGKVYTDGFKESEKIIVDVMSDSDVQAVKNFIETEGKGAFYTDITPLGPDKGIRLCAGEESLMNIQGDVAQFMEENNIRGYTYSGDVITVVCVEKEDIEKIKAFVAEKGYRAERLEYTLPDFEVDPPETAPTELEDIRMALDDFIKQQGINGFTKIAPHKAKDMVWVILDPFGDEYQRKISLFMYLYGIDADKVLFDGIVYNAGDVNRDTIIDARDASAVLTEYAQTSTGKAPTFTGARFHAADINKDGVLDGRDASAILSYYTYTSTSTENIPTMEAFAFPTVTETTELWCIFRSSLEWNGVTYHDNDSVDVGDYTRDAYIGKVSDFKGVYKDTVNYRIHPDDSVYTTKESKDVLIVIKAGVDCPTGAEVAMTSADYNSALPVTS